MNYNYTLSTTLLVVLLSIFNFSNAQTVFWSEDFDGNSGMGSNWGELNDSIGPQGADANRWYISDEEDGNSPGECGTSGSGDASLHVGSTTLGDIGAAYDAGCASGCFVCDLTGICVYSSTNVRSASADINTTGLSDMVLNLNYIENGEGSDDDCIIEYSIDGGATWSLLTNTVKPATGLCFPQGQWTSFAVAIPTDAEGITNLQIGFRWQNDADGVGTDPSFAVDDINITTTTVLPIVLKSFDAEMQEARVDLEWTTAMELNNDYFTIERSANGQQWETIITEDGAGNSQQAISYSSYDPNPLYGVSYYRLKQTDYDGEFTYSDAVAVKNSMANGEAFVSVPNGSKQLQLQLSEEMSDAQIQLWSLSGKLVWQQPLNDEQLKYKFELPELAKGMYMAQISDEGMSLHSQLVSVQ